MGREATCINYSAWLSKDAQRRNMVICNLGEHRSEEYFDTLKALGNFLRDVMMTTVTPSWNTDHECRGVRHRNFLEEPATIAGY
jgi:hypothetical protein